MTTHPSVILLAERLVELGFRKRTGMIFTKPVSAEYLGWIGLNRASRKRPTGHVLMHPVIGVGHLPLERAIATGRGEKFHSYLPPSLSEPLRYLVPVDARRDWIFTGADTDREVLDSIVDAVAGPAADFILEHSDLTRLAQIFEAKHATDQKSAYRWPAALWQLGRPDDARAAADIVVDELVARTDQAADELRSFMAWLKERTAAPA